MNVLAVTTAVLLGVATAVPLLWHRLRLLRARIDQQDHEYIEASAALEAARSRFNRLSAKLVEVGVVETYCLPVLLVGPRAVGKTSLLAQWETPWSAARPSPTFRHRSAEVPVCNVESIATRPHFADPEILTPVHAQLMLRVHDFAGEAHAQQVVEKIIRQETAELRAASEHDLGLVVVCMFDATEAVTGLAEETRRYYNGELFQRLRRIVFEGGARIDRMILVFNKVDRAQAAAGADVSAAQIREHCFRTFLGAFPEIGHVCNPDRICGVLTMLDGMNPDVVRGAPMVMGEAARGFVEAFGAGDVANRISNERGASVPAALLRQTA